MPSLFVALNNVSLAHSMNLPPAIDFQNVWLFFDEKPALSNVSFNVARGETLILMGATGSGKSVILKLALGLLKADEGQVIVEGRDLGPVHEKGMRDIRQRMGIVFQEGALFDSLSVYENVAYRLREAGMRNEDAIEHKAREVLSFVELEGAIDKMPAELSGGMKRRVSIARAIINDPPIMLYDSPTGGLDPVTAQTINILILKLQEVQGVSSIVVTHRLQDAFWLTRFAYSKDTGGLVPVSGNGTRVPTIASRFLVLREGSVYFHGTLNEAVPTRDPYLQHFLR
ncbi:MAG: ATP-binding cassette domain-containing protein [Acidobacteria bacterium]|nr:MAG: ATP-binding cassette domain-containing protein [Acidobacteriota bacterium]